MPSAPLRPCPRQGCSALVPHGLCPAHTQARQAARRTTVERGYDAAWDRLRVHCFARDGWRCVDCGWEPDCIRIARLHDLPSPPRAVILRELADRHNANERHLHGDHIQDIADRPDLRLDPDNIRTRCSSCHSAKTARKSFHQQG